MLRYLYGFEYTDGVHFLEIILNTRMYGLADKYEIPNLKGLATTKFELVARARWNSVEFPLSIKIIYKSTPLSDRDLWDIVTKLAVEHSMALFENNDTFLNMENKVVEFVRDVAERRVYV
jgi:speckle-type POZ protein